VKAGICTFDPVASEGEASGKGGFGYPRAPLTAVLGRSQLGKKIKRGSRGRGKCEGGDLQIFIDTTQNRGSEISPGGLRRLEALKSKLKTNITVYVERKAE